MRSGILCNPGIICGPIWGLFSVRDHLRSWDHLQSWDYLQSNLGINCDLGSFADPYRALTVGKLARCQFSWTKSSKENVLNSFFKLNERKDNIMGIMKQKTCLFLFLQCTDHGANSPGEPTLIQSSRTEIERNYRQVPS